MSVNPEQCDVKMVTLQSFMDKCQVVSHASRGVSLFKKSNGTEVVDHYMKQGDPLGMGGNGSVFGYDLKKPVPKSDSLCMSQSQQHKNQPVQNQDAKTCHTIENVAFKVYEYSALHPKHHRYKKRNIRKKRSIEYIELAEVHHETLMYGALHALGCNAVAPKFHGYVTDLANEIEGLVIERMQGSLQDFQPQSLGDVECIAVELLKLLVQWQSQGIVHCDLKQPNILISEQGRCVRVCDWGSGGHICGVSDSVATTITVRPPEMLMHCYWDLTAEDVDRRKVDVWGAGLIILQLWCRLYKLPEPMDSTYRGHRLLRDEFYKFRMAEPGMTSEQAEYTERMIFKSAAEKYLSTHALESLMTDMEMPLPWRVLLCNMLHADPEKRAGLKDLCRFLANVYPEIKVTYNSVFHSIFDGRRKNCSSIASLEKTMSCESGHESNNDSDVELENNIKRLSIDV